MTPAEIARLDALAAERGTTRSGVLRGVLDAAVEPTTKSTTTQPEPSRARVLAQLADAAEAGSVQAMTTLARELRLGGPPPTPKTGPVTPDELHAGLRAVR